MDNKKKGGRRDVQDDLRGFEEFIDRLEEAPLQDKGPKNVGGENLAFLQYDQVRLTKLAGLLAGRVPVMGAHPQGEALIARQRDENERLRMELFTRLGPADSPFQRAMGSLFDGFFAELRK